MDVWEWDTGKYFYVSATSYLLLLFLLFSVIIIVVYYYYRNSDYTSIVIIIATDFVQIFSIMMTGMALINPIKAIASTNETFRAFDKNQLSNTEGQKQQDSDSYVDLRLPKLIFVSIQILALALAVYKCSMMGLLPLTSADWISYLPIIKNIEHSAIVI